MALAFVVLSNKEKAARAGLLRQRTPLLKCEMDDFLGKTCLNAALRWFLGGSTQWLSTGNAEEPQNWVNLSLPSAAPVCQLLPALDEAASEATRREESALRL